MIGPVKTSSLQNIEHFYIVATNSRLGIKEEYRVRMKTVEIVI